MAETGNEKIKKINIKDSLRKALRKTGEWITKGGGAMYLILYVAWPIVMNLIIESLARKSLFGGLIHLVTSPYVFLVNTLIILLTLSVTFLVRRRLFWVGVISVVWITFGIANFVLLCNRVTPFSAVDLKLIDSAIAVMDKYLSNVQFTIAIFAVIAAVIILIVLFFKAPKYKKKINFLRSCGMIFIVAILTFGSIRLGLYTGQLEEQFTELSKSYLKNGFVYCFSNSLVNTGVKKPSNYSAEKISEITGSNTGDGEEETSTGSDAADHKGDGENPDEILTPNIIIVQLESFFDVNEVMDLTFSENPLPNFTKLMEEWDSGYFSVPVVGAGTVNTEFEVLTGMNLDDFGPGEYPFKTVMKNTTCESIAYDLMENGWNTMAVHNNTGGFYGRNNIYARLGIQQFTSVEYMQVNDYTPMGWAKDFVLTDYIFKSLESTKGQDFVLTISVQGHGSYPSDADYERVIEVEDIWNESLREQVTYYINQIYEMDQFIGELVAALEEFNEDTILVMYGDHLPSLGFTDSQMESGSIYDTEYFIWNNMGLEFGDEDIEAYQLSSKLLQAIGVETGVINKYHQTYKGTEEYLNGLQNLEYDILYGDKLCYDGINPYEMLDIVMGIDPVEITSIHDAEAYYAAEEETGQITAKTGEEQSSGEEKIGESEESSPTETQEEGGNSLNEPSGESQTGTGEEKSEDKVSDTAVAEMDEEDDEDAKDGTLWPENLEGYVVVKGKNFTNYSRVYVNGSKFSTTFIDSETLLIYDPDLKGLDSFVVWQSTLSCTSECLYYGE